MVCFHSFREKINDRKGFIERRLEEPYLARITAASNWTCKEKPLGTVGVSVKQKRASLDQTASNWNQFPKCKEKLGSAFDMEPDLPHMPPASRNDEVSVYYKDKVAQFKPRSSVKAFKSEIFMVTPVLGKYLSLVFSISLRTLTSNQPPFQTLLAGKYTLKNICVKLQIFLKTRTQRRWNIWRICTN